MGLKLFAYWDTGYAGMPPFLQYIHDHNARMCEKFDIEFVFLSDANITQWLDVPTKFWDAEPVHRSDIIRFLVLDKYGGVWLDTDGLVLKDLNVVYKYLLDSGKDAIFDKDMYGDHIIGSASLVVLPNTLTSKFLTDRNLLKFNTTDSPKWGDLGPPAVTEVASIIPHRVTVNPAAVAGQCVNFVCWNYYPGYNRDKWYLPTEEEALNTAQQMFNSSYSYYTLTWTIYNKNTIPGDLVDFVFRDKRSIYTHLIELASQPI